MPRKQLAAKSAKSSAHKTAVSVITHNHSLFLESLLTFMQAAAGGVKKFVATSINNPPNCLFANFPSICSQSSAVMALQDAAEAYFVSFVRRHQLVHHPR